MIRITQVGRTQAVAQQQKKINERRAHFEETVLASIHPRVPKTAIDNNSDGSDDVLSFLSGVTADGSEFVDRRPDYTKYEGMGWNSQVVQEVKFDRAAGHDGARDTMYHYLGAETGPDTGFVYRAVVNEKDRPVWGDNGYVVLDEDNPIGTWTLDRAPRSEVDISRERTACFAMLGDEEVEVNRFKVHGDLKENPFIYASALDPNCLDPSERVPVRTQVQRWTEPSQIMHLTNGSFAFRNYLGILTLANDARGSVSWHVVEKDEKQIGLARTEYEAKLNNWKGMTSEARAAAGRAKNYRLIPFSGGMEAFIVQTRGVENRKDGYWVPVEQNSKGEWKQVK